MLIEIPSLEFFSGKEATVEFHELRYYELAQLWVLVYQWNVGVGSAAVPMIISGQVDRPRVSEFNDRRHTGQGRSHCTPHSYVSLACKNRDTGIMKCDEL